MSVEENSPKKKTYVSPFLELLKSETFKLIKQGAEAKLYQGTYENNEVLIKERFKKTYRIQDLDKSLNKKRTKIEEKLLNRSLALGVNVPKVLKTDLENGLIVMEFISNSSTSRDFILNLVKSTLHKTQDEISSILQKLAHEIGRVVGKLHSEHIIHGDLTTSNMLLKNYEQLDLDNLDKHLYFIDFGLSHISSQLEDKGVDLYVLERALLSTHSVQAKDLMDNILLGYQKEHKENYEDVLNKLNQVRLRGRKRSMIG